MNVHRFWVISVILLCNCRVDRAVTVVYPAKKENYKNIISELLSIKPTGAVNEEGFFKLGIANRFPKSMEEIGVRGDRKEFSSNRFQSVGHWIYAEKDIYYGSIELWFNSRNYFHYTYRGNVTIYFGLNRNSYGDLIPYTNPNCELSSNFLKDNKQVILCPALDTQKIPTITLDFKEDPNSSVSVPYTTFTVGMIGLYGAVLYPAFSLIPVVFLGFYTKQGFINVDIKYND